MKIRLATRTSALALFQTNRVVDLLLQKDAKLDCEVVGVKTKGDQDQKTALHQLGQTGIFTKALDDAILEGRADVGVHSLKDYPTQMPQGLTLLAVLPRDGVFDAFIPGQHFSGFDSALKVLSGSPRRRAQWQARYPHHTFDELRGNMDTRLAKMHAGDGGIVSAPGLERLGLLPENAQLLDWMIPAPAQGVIAVVGRAGDLELAQIFAQINDQNTYRCAHIERRFMAAVEGGCASPLGALAAPIDDRIHFQGVLLSKDGKREVRVERAFGAEMWPQMGDLLAQELLEQGGSELMEELKREQPTDVLCLKPVTATQRTEALSKGLLLHDLEVLHLAARDFLLEPAEIVGVGSAFGAQQLVPHVMELPSEIWCIGEKASGVLRSAGYAGHVRVFRNSGELVQHFQVYGPKLVYYGAEHSSTNWSNWGIQHVVTYENSPTKPALARQNWDVIAAFSPMGLRSICARNDFPKNTPVVVIGKSTEAEARALGFEQVWCAESANWEGMMKGLEKSATLKK